MNSTLPHPLIQVRLNRAASAEQFLMATMRYRLGLRKRPTKPPGLSPQTADAVRALANALLSEPV